MAAASMGKVWRQLQDLLAGGQLGSLTDSELLDRFLRERDELAFAVLVERHGPMVLGTCRAVLGDAAAAEDAFQATFLVLVCKASSIRGQRALASWLYQVARRIAIQAGTEEGRRRRHERLAAELRATAESSAEPDGDRLTALHDEIARLSDKHRLPLLLCDLEGKTHAQAAAELKCGEATVRRRLVRARDILRARLVRRGLTLAAGALTTNLGRSALAKVPPCWAEATIKAATRMSSTAARIAVGDIVSTAAANLARRTLHAMLFRQLRVAAALVVLPMTLVGIAWAIGTFGHEPADPPLTGQTRSGRSAPGVVSAPAKSEKPAGPSEIVTYRGRVVNAEGRPVPGAALYINPRAREHPYRSPVRATGGPDGLFRFTVPKSEFDTSYWESPWIHPCGTVLARADGYAFGLATHRDDAEELTIRLVRDDIPISSRIIDGQGQPVVGATVTVLKVECPAGASLDGWLKALEHPKDSGPPLQKLLPTSMLCRTDPPFITPVITGADGRFRISGIGRERVATLAIEGPTIETVHVQVRTRPGATIRGPRFPNDSDEGMLPVYGATFELVANPTRPIEGVVRDKETGAPLAGIMVHGNRELESIGPVHAITDAQGRYRLVGLPRSHEVILQAVAPVDFPFRFGERKAALHGPRDEDLPYLSASIKLREPAGTGPIKLDINLKRGVWVTGRVLEADTGKPVRAEVLYFVLADNPHLEDGRASPGMSYHYHDVGRDGAFRIVAFPGPGLLTASGRRGDYIQGEGVDTLKYKRHGRDGYIQAYPNGVIPEQYQVVAEIDPAPGMVSMRRDLVLQRGRSLTIAVFGPDGKPVSGNEVEVLGRGMGYWEKNTVPSTFSVPNWRPGEERLIRFVNRERRLTGEIMLREDGPGLRSINLQPWGALTGRLMNADGQPWDVEGELDLHPLGQYTKVGKDGRFRCEGLTPGKAYSIMLRKKGSLFHDFGLGNVTVEPGETKDLGDIVPRPPR